MRSVSHSPFDALYWNHWNLFLTKTLLSQITHHTSKNYEYIDSRL